MRKVPLTLSLLVSFAGGGDANLRAREKLRPDHNEVSRKLNIECADVVELENGAKLSAEINFPFDEVYYVQPGGSVDVDIVGTASIGVGEPQIHYTYVIDTSGSTINSGGSCGNIFQCEQKAIMSLNSKIAESGAAVDIGLTRYDYAGFTQEFDGSFLASAEGDELYNKVNSLSITDCTGDLCTNFAGGLRAAMNSIQETEAPEKIVFFMSDGESNQPDKETSNGMAQYNAAVAAMKAAGATIYSFAIGEGVNCTNGDVGTLQYMADETDGTCTRVVNPEDLEKAISDIVETEMISVQLSVNDENIVTKLDNPTTFPGPDSTKASSTKVSSVGFHKVCIKALGQGPIGASKPAGCCIVYEVRSASTPAPTELEPDEPLPIPGKLFGLVYEDTNGNGEKDIGEPGIGGVNVMIYGDGGTFTVTTSASGEYSQDLLPGTYTTDIDEKSLDGAQYTQTQGTNPTVGLEVPSGGRAYDVDGFQPNIPGKIVGLVYEDTNGNGKQDDGEPGIGGVDVVISRDGGAFGVTTSRSGEYSLNVSPGTYTTTIDEDTLPGGIQFVQTHGDNPTDDLEVKPGGIARDVDGFRPITPSPSPKPTEAPLLDNECEAELENGAKLSAEINLPNNGAVFYVNPGGSYDVDIAGTASIGVGQAHMHYTYVIDTSGSTINPGGSCGNIFQCEQKAIMSLNDQVSDSGAAVDVGLTSYDRDGEAHTFDGSYLTDPDSDSIDNAVNAMSFTDCTGYNCTNFAGGLRAAMNSIQETEAPDKIVFFLSDGESNQPPKEDDGMEQYNAAVAAMKEVGATIYSFAIGESATCTNGDVGTLQYMADQTGGACTRVVNPEDLEKAISDFVKTEMISVQLMVDDVYIDTDLDNPTKFPGPDSTDATGIKPSPVGIYEACIKATGQGPIGYQKTIENCCVKYRVLTAPTVAPEPDGDLEQPSETPSDLPSASPSEFPSSSPSKDTCFKYRCPLKPRHKPYKPKPKPHTPPKQKKPVHKRPPKGNGKGSHPRRPKFPKRRPAPKGKGGKGWHRNLRQLGGDHEKKYGIPICYRDASKSWTKYEYKTMCVDPDEFLPYPHKYFFGHHRRLTNDEDQWACGCCPPDVYEYWPHGRPVWCDKPDPYY